MNIEYVLLKVSSKEKILKELEDFNVPNVYKVEFISEGFESFPEYVENHFDHLIDQCEIRVKSPGSYICNITGAFIKATLPFLTEKFAEVHYMIHPMVDNEDFRLEYKIKDRPTQIGLEADSADTNYYKLYNGELTEENQKEILQRVIQNIYVENHKNKIQIYIHV